MIKGTMLLQHLMVVTYVVTWSFGNERKLILSKQIYLKYNLGKLWWNYVGCHLL